MLINKHKYLVQSDHKVLHKVKKNWVVLSMSLLALLGGGAVAHQTAAHAAANSHQANDPATTLKDRINASLEKGQTVKNQRTPQVKVHNQQVNAQQISQQADNLHNQIIRNASLNQNAASEQSATTQKSQTNTQANVNHQTVQNDPINTGNSAVMNDDQGRTVKDSEGIKNYTSDYNHDATAKDGSAFYRNPLAGNHDDYIGNNPSGHEMSLPNDKNQNQSSAGYIYVDNGKTGKDKETYRVAQDDDYQYNLKNNFKTEHAANSSNVDYVTSDKRVTGINNNSNPLTVNDTTMHITSSDVVYGEINNIDYYYYPHGGTYSSQVNANEDAEWMVNGKSVPGILSENEAVTDNGYKEPGTIVFRDGATSASTLAHFFSDGPIITNDKATAPGTNKSFKALGIINGSLFKQARIVQYESAWVRDTYNFDDMMENDNNVRLINFGTYFNPGDTNNEKPVSMVGMMQRDPNLRYINISGAWGVVNNNVNPSIKSVASMCQSDYSLQGIDFPTASDLGVIEAKGATADKYPFSTANISDFSQMFESDPNFYSITVPSSFTTQNLFIKYQQDKRQAEQAGKDPKNVTSGMHDMFKNATLHYVMNQSSDFIIPSDAGLPEQQMWYDVLNPSDVDLSKVLQAQPTPYYASPFQIPMIYDAPLPQGQYVTSAGNFPRTNTKFSLYHQLTDSDKQNLLEQAVGQLKLTPSDQQAFSDPNSHKNDSKANLDASGNFIMGEAAHPSDNLTSLMKWTTKYAKVLLKNSDSDNAMVQRLGADIASVMSNFWGDAAGGGLGHYPVSNYVSHAISSGFFNSLIGAYTQNSYSDTKDAQHNAQAALAAINKADGAGTWNSSSKVTNAQVMQEILRYAALCLAAQPAHAENYHTAYYKPGAGVGTPYLTAISSEDGTWGVKEGAVDLSSIVTANYQTPQQLIIPPSDYSGNKGYKIHQDTVTRDVTEFLPKMFPGIIAQIANKLGGYNPKNVVYLTAAAKLQLTNSDVQIFNNPSKYAGKSSFITASDKLNTANNGSWGTPLNAFTIKYARMLLPHDEKVAEYLSHDMGAVIDGGFNFSGFGPGQSANGVSLDFHRSDFNAQTMKTLLLVSLAGINNSKLSGAIDQSTSLSDEKGMDSLVKDVILNNLPIGLINNMFVVNELHNIMTTKGSLSDTALEKQANQANASGNSKSVNPSDAVAILKPFLNNPTFVKDIQAPFLNDPDFLKLMLNHPNYLYDQMKSSTPVHGISSQLANEVQQAVQMLQYKDESVQLPGVNSDGSIDDSKTYPLSIDYLMGIKTLQNMFNDPVQFKLLTYIQKIVSNYLNTEIPYDLYGSYIPVKVPAGFHVYDPTTGHVLSSPATRDISDYGVETETQKNLNGVSDTHPKRDQDGQLINTGAHHVINAGEEVVLVPDNGKKNNYYLIPDFSDNDLVYYEAPDNDGSYHLVASYKPGHTYSIPEAAFQTNPTDVQHPDDPKHLKPGNQLRPSDTSDAIWQSIETIKNIPADVIKSKGKHITGNEEYINRKFKAGNADGSLPNGFENDSSDSDNYIQNYFKVPTSDQNLVYDGGTHVIYLQRNSVNLHLTNSDGLQAPQLPSISINDLSKYFNVSGNSSDVTKNTYTVKSDDSDNGLLPHGWAFKLNPGHRSQSFQFKKVANWMSLVPVGTLDVEPVYDGMRYHYNAGDNSVYFVNSVSAKDQPSDMSDFLSTVGSDDNPQVVLTHSKNKSSDKYGTTNNPNDVYRKILHGKGIGFLGSSITYGWLWNHHATADGRSFVDDLANNDGIKRDNNTAYDGGYNYDTPSSYPYDNYKNAVTGTTMIDPGTAPTFINRMVNYMHGPYDAFVVQLSTNDATQGKPMGQIKSDHFDKSTITGAIQYIDQYVHDHFHCPVLFYTCLDKDGNSQANYTNTPDPSGSSGYYYGQMVDQLYRVQQSQFGKKYPIQILDLYNNSDLNKLYNYGHKYVADNNADVDMRMHPTYLGYAKELPYFEKALAKIFYKKSITPSQIANANTITFGSDVHINSSNLTNMLGNDLNLQHLTLSKNFNTSGVNVTNLLNNDPNLQTLTINSSDTRLGSEAKVPTMYQETGSQDPQGHYYTLRKPNDFSQGNVGTFNKTLNPAPSYTITYYDKKGNPIGLPQNFSDAASDQPIGSNTATLSAGGIANGYVLPKGYHLNSNEPIPTFHKNQKTYKIYIIHDRESASIKYETNSDQVISQTKLSDSDVMSHQFNLNDWDNDNHAAPGLAEGYHVSQAATVPYDKQTHVVRVAPNQETVTIDFVSDQSHSNAGQTTLNGKFTFGSTVNLPTNVPGYAIDPNQQAQVKIGANDLQDGSNPGQASFKLLVHPKDLHDQIKFVLSGNRIPAGYTGLTGVLGSDSIDYHGTHDQIPYVFRDQQSSAVSGMPPNYHVAGNQSVSYDGLIHRIQIAPNNETEYVRYVRTYHMGAQAGSQSDVNDTGKIEINGSSSAAYAAKLSGPYAVKFDITSSSSNASNLPTNSYQLEQSDNSFVYLPGSANFITIPVVPTSAGSINLSYINETGQQLASGTFSGKYNEAFASATGHIYEKNSSHSTNTGNHIVSDNPDSRDYTLDLSQQSLSDILSDYKFSSDQQDITVPLSGKSNASQSTSSNQVNVNIREVNSDGSLISSTSSNDPFKVYLHGDIGSFATLDPSDLLESGGSYYDSNLSGDRVSPSTAAGSTYYLAGNNSDMTSYGTGTLYQTSSEYSAGQPHLEPGSIADSGSSIASVTFTYESNPTPGTITVQYRDDQTGQLVSGSDGNSDVISPAAGTNGQTINVTSSGSRLKVASGSGKAAHGENIPDGYTLADKNMPNTIYMVNSHPQDVVLYVHKNDQQSLFTNNSDNGQNKNYLKYPLTINLVEQLYTNGNKSTSSDNGWTHGQKVITKTPRVDANADQEALLRASSYVPTEGSDSVVPASDKSCTIQFNKNGSLSILGSNGQPIDNENANDTYSIKNNQVTSADGQTGIVFHYNVYAKGTTQYRNRIHYVSYSDMDNSDDITKTFNNHNFLTTVGNSGKNGTPFSDGPYRKNVPKGYQFVKVLKVNSDSDGNTSNGIKKENSDNGLTTYGKDRDQDEYIEVIPNASNITVHYVDQNGDQIAQHTFSGSDQSQVNSKGYSSKFGQFVPYASIEQNSDINLDDPHAQYELRIQPYHTADNSVASNSTFMFGRQPQDVKVTVVGKQEIAAPITVKYVNQTGSIVGSQVFVGRYNDQVDVVGQNDQNVPENYTLEPNNYYPNNNPQGTNQTVKYQTVNYRFSNQPQTVYLTVTGNNVDHNITIERVMTQKDGSQKISDMLGTLTGDQGSSVEVDPSDYNPDSSNYAPDYSHDSVQFVTMDNTKGAMPNKIVFYYQSKQADAAPITMRYVNQAGHVVGGTQILQGDIGDQIKINGGSLGSLQFVSKNHGTKTLGEVPHGYQLNSGQRTVTFTNSPQTLTVTVTGVEHSDQFTVNVITQQSDNSKTTSAMTPVTVHMKVRVGDNFRVSPYGFNVTATKTSTNPNGFGITSISDSKSKAGKIGSANIAGVVNELNGNNNGSYQVPAGYHVTNSDSDINGVVNSDGNLAPLNYVNFIYQKDIKSTTPLDKVCIHYVTTANKAGDGQTPTINDIKYHEISKESNEGYNETDMFDLRPYLHDIPESLSQFYYLDTTLPAVDSNGHQINSNNYLWKFNQPTRDVYVRIIPSNRPIVID